MIPIGSWLSRSLLLAGLLAVGGWGQPTCAQSKSVPAAFSYRQASLRTVLQDVHQRTGYRFLYRDALVAGRSVTLSADSAEVLSALRETVSGAGLRMEVDRARRQVLLAPAPQGERATTTVTGYVVDAQDGGRLPRATVVWHDAEGRRNGAVANENGRVRFRLEPAALPDRVTIVASHVGYEPASVTISPEQPPTELPFRLTPESTPGPDVTVRTNAFPTALDSTWDSFTQPDLFSPLGEASVLRSLQTLPSVAITSALSDGMHVRGSQSDGFHVQIDGMPIYNQSHLFGLFDAFNDEALRTVGFFADVAPARYRAPPGGTLSFQTRRGARTGFGGTAELSNTAVSATVDGPLGEGRGSWLLSARRSYLDTVNWFKNDDLIAQGVGWNLRMEEPTEEERLTGSNGDLVGEPSAAFYDVHGTLQYEWPAGSRLTVSGYLGGDRTEVPFGKEGIVTEIGKNGTSDERVSVGPDRFETDTKWGNEAASIQLGSPLRSELFVHTTLSVSRYHAQFKQPNLSAPVLSSGSPESGALSTFGVQNELVDATLKQRVDGALETGAWTAGYMARLLSIDYRMQGVGLLDAQQRRRAIQGDLFGQYDRRAVGGWANVHLGLRLHGFSPGPYGRLSPRVWVEGWPERSLSATIGYTRNHQFLHRLSGARRAQMDTWTMSTAHRPPATSDHVTLGIKTRPHPNWTLRLNGYYKEQRRVRLSDPSLAGDQAASLSRPWATGQVTTRGGEVLHRLDGAGWQWTASYALSHAELRLVEVRTEGKRSVPWDRRHQGATRIQVEIGEAWSGHLTWLAASGRPNGLDQVDLRLADLVSEEPARLLPYHRLDAALQYERRVAGVELTARLAAFNLYDRDNPRYRRLVGISGERPPRRGSELQLAGVNVYDLGFQPSFRFSATW